MTLPRDLAQRRAILGRPDHSAETKAGGRPSVAAALRCRRSAAVDVRRTGSPEEISHLWQSANPPMPTPRQRWHMALARSSAYNC